MKLWTWLRERPIRLPRKTFIQGATFKRPVVIEGDGAIHNSIFELEQVAKPVLQSGAGLTITSCTLNTRGGIMLAGGGATFAPPVGDDEEPEPELALTFGVEPLVAWRAWSLETFRRRDGTTEKRLAPWAQSRIAPYLWPYGRPMEAVCAQHAHDAPERHCNCGIWALPAEARIGEAITAEPSVWGSVYLWGRVLEFEKGFRAQYAYPKEMFTREAELAVELAELYGVPVKEVA